MPGRRGSLAERFWRRVDKSARCWTWTGSTDKGYGQIGGPNRSVLSAHRVSWELHNGPVPDGLFVCHRCDNPGCVNPAHLFVGTPKDNSRDMVAKGRSCIGERNGQSKLSGDDVLFIVDMVSDGIPQWSVAKMFGISQAHVSNIWRRKTRTAEFAEMVP